MSLENDHMHEEPDFSFDRNEKQPFGLPSDYFNAFEEKLRSRMEAETELSEFPILSGIARQTVFSVPEAYFLSSAESLEAKAEIQGYPNLSQVNKRLAPELDSSYADELFHSVNYRVGLADELSPYKTLYNLDKVNGFALDDNYFETLADRVKARVHAAAEVQPTILDRLWLALFNEKISWAFGLVFILGLAIVFTRQEQNLQESGDCKTLACLERDEILNSKAINAFDEEQLMDLVDVNSLQKQLNLDETRKDTLAGDPLPLPDTNDEELLDAL